MHKNLWHRHLADKSYIKRFLTGDKGTTLQSRLNLFFALVVISVILIFTLLLVIFGFTGNGRQSIYDYLKSELQHISIEMEKDFGNLALVGINLAETLSESSDAFFEEYDLTAEELASQPEYVEKLLEKQMSSLLGVASHNACGGVFVVLENTTTQNTKPGIFIKKTQPVSSTAFTSKMYCLRGPAHIAIDHNIELLGQWYMNFDREEIPFYDFVIKTAAENPDLPLSRLYYWSGRLRLNDNSETGILLCLPLRSSDGTILGVCGIEISDRMFKILYSPQESNYQGVFAVIAPWDGASFHAQNGLLAGNSYLSGSQMTQPFQFLGKEKEFLHYQGERDRYGGLAKNFKLYSTDSPYINEEWELAVLVPNDFLNNAIKGNTTSFALIVGGLFIIGLIGCAYTSKRYLRPIQQGILSIREKAYETPTASADFGVAEIDSLFEELAQEIYEYKKEAEKLHLEKMQALEQYEKAKTQIDRLSNKRKQEIEPDEYALFLNNVETLTTTERKVFNLYLEGKTPKEILEILQIKENTLKYHNRNIYGKLGVSSRKQLLTYAAIMEQQG